MKPTCAPVMEVPTKVSTTPRNDVNGRTCNRRMVYILIGIFVFAIVVASVLLSVYFGTKMVENDKEYDIIYVQDGFEQETGSVLVTDTEEVFTTDKGIGIVDFSKDLITFKISYGNMSWTDCYVTNLNESDFLSPAEFINTFQSTQVTLKMENKNFRSFEATDIKLNNKALGPKSSEMCRGISTYFVRETEGKVARRKRGEIILRIRIGDTEIILIVRWQKQ